MTYLSRRVSAAVLAVSLSLILSTAAVAAPRQNRDDREWSGKIIRIVQKFFGIATHESYPMPPKP